MNIPTIRQHHPNDISKQNCTRLIHKHILNQKNMATSKKKGGPASGKTGNTVSYWLNGQWVTRTIGVNNKEPTVLQLAVWHVTSLIATLLRPVKSFIKIGFALEVKHKPMYPYSKAVAENYEKALKGEYPEVEIDYPKAVFSKGSMPVNYETTVELSDKGIRFTWDASSIFLGMHPNDRVMMVAYCPEKKYAFYDPDGARRKEGTDFLPMIKYPDQVVIHTYVAFIAANKKSISTTFYTGEFLW